MAKKQPTNYRFPRKNLRFVGISCWVFALVREASLGSVIEWLQTRCAQAEAKNAAILERENEVRRGLAKCQADHDHLLSEYEAAEKLAAERQAYILALVQPFFGDREEGLAFFEICCGQQEHS